MPPVRIEPKEGAAVHIWYDIVSKPSAEDPYLVWGWFTNIRGSSSRI